MLGYGLDWSWKSWFMDFSKRTWVIFPSIWKMVRKIRAEQLLEIYMIQKWCGQCTWNLLLAYLDSPEEDYNVVCVDWGPLARGSGPLASIFYPLVIENVPKVGEKIADLISFLRSQGFVNTFESVHLIGFSLGAHAAGIAGSLLQRRLFRKIGRITGNIWPLYVLTFMYVIVVGLFVKYCKVLILDRKNTELIVESRFHSNLLICWTLWNTF